MNEKLNIRFINKFLMVGGTLLITAAIFWVSKQVGFLALLLKLLSGLLPVILAMSLSYILEPLISFLVKLKIKRVLAVIIVYLGLGGIITLFLFLLIPNLISQLKEFFESLPQIIESTKKISQDFKNKIGVNVQLDVLIDKFIAGITTSSIKYLTSIANFFLVIAITLTGAIFISFDFLDLKVKIKKGLSKKKNNKTYQFLSSFLPSLHRYTVGLLIDNLILFILSSFIFYLAGAKYPFLFGLIVALTNFIPLIGQFIGGVPIVLIGFSMSLEKGIIFLLIIIILQFFESNVIQPLIMRATLKIKPIENLIGVAVCGQLFGITGMVIAPFFIIAIKIFLSKSYLKENNSE